MKALSWMWGAGSTASGRDTSKTDKKLSDLPQDVMSNIYTRLRAQELCNLRLVSKNILASVDAHDPSLKVMGKTFALPQNAMKAIYAQLGAKEICALRGVSKNFQAFVSHDVALNAIETMVRGVAAYLVGTKQKDNKFEIWLASQHTSGKTHFYVTSPVRLAFGGSSTETLSLIKDALWIAYYAYKGNERFKQKQLRSAEAKSAMYVTE